MQKREISQTEAIALIDEQRPVKKMGSRGLEETIEMVHFGGVNGLVRGATCHDDGEAIHVSGTAGWNYIAARKP